MSQTFTALGQTWTSHTPGDPMPCDPTREVQILMRDYDYEPDETRQAGYYNWKSIPYTKPAEIIGWRYASPDQPKAESTELERLQEENRLMRDAIKEASDLLLDGENTRAGSTLQPFIKP